MMRYDARVAVEAELKTLGLFRGKEPRDMQLPRCSRSGDIIEPMVQPQWFVDCADMAKRSCDAVRDGSLKILPKEHEKTWFHWLENIQPWCISRQLWWGHRIPAYFATKKGEDAEAIDRNDEGEAWRWVVARTRAAVGGREEAQVQASRREPRAGRGRARHVVLVGPVPVLGLRLARRHARHAHVLPDDIARDGARHPLLLGRAHGDDGPAAHRPAPVHVGLPARDGARQGGPEDVQVEGQRD